MHLASLIKLLNYAVRLDLIRANEASGLTVKAPSSEKARRSFDLPALKSIFSSPVYAAGHRPKGGGGERNVTLLNIVRIAEAMSCKPSDILVDAGL